MKLWPLFFALGITMPLWGMEEQPLGDNEMAKIIANLDLSYTYYNFPPKDYNPAWPKPTQNYFKEWLEDDFAELRYGILVNHPEKEKLFTSNPFLKTLYIQFPALFTSGNLLGIIQTLLRVSLESNRKQHDPISDLSPLGWCSCENANLATRLLLILKQLEALTKNFPDKKNPLIITSFTSGRLLQDFALCAALLTQGYLNLTYNLIDHAYAPERKGSSEYLDPQVLQEAFTRLMRTILPTLYPGPQITFNFFGSADEYLTSKTPAAHLAQLVDPGENAYFLKSPSAAHANAFLVAYDTNAVALTPFDRAIRYLNPWVIGKIPLPQQNIIKDPRTPNTKIIDTLSKALPAPTITYYRNTFSEFKNIIDTKLHTNGLVFELVLKTITDHFLDYTDELFAEAKWEQVKLMPDISLFDQDLQAVAQAMH